jgi:hypothetical protein
MYARKSNSSCSCEDSDAEGGDVGDGEGIAGALAATADDRARNVFSRERESVESGTHTKINNTKMKII